MKLFVAIIFCLSSAISETWSDSSSSESSSSESQPLGIKPDDSDIKRLFAAIRDKNVPSAEDLLSTISVNCQDDYLFTPLMRAAEEGDEKMVEMLLKHGADVNKYDPLNRFTPLILASRATRGGFEEIIKMLIEHGADVNAPDRYDMLPLHYAAQYGHDRIAELLFEHGAEKQINLKHFLGKTPLCCAAYNGGYNSGHDRIVEMMIQHGVDVNISCEEDGTALHLATLKNRKNIVELLVQHGADIAAKNENGKTALDLARDESNTPLVDYLAALEH